MAQLAPHRPRVLVALAAGLTLAGCGVNERDPHRFAALADSVAAIPVSAEVGEEAEPASTAEAARASPNAKAKGAPLKVELLTPHELWDARDSVAGKARMAAVALPSGFRDLEAPISERPSAVAPETRRVAPPPAAGSRSVQLGAFSSEEGARAAWARLSRGPGAAVLAGLQPVYEDVDVGGRRLVRLKVAAAPERAQALCRAVASSDPWCARAAEARPSTGAA